VIIPWTPWHSMLASEPCRLGLAEILTHGQASCGAQVGSRQRSGQFIPQCHKAEQHGYLRLVGLQGAY